MALQLKFYQICLLLVISSSLCFQQKQDQIKVSSLDSEINFSSAQSSPGEYFSFIQTKAEESFSSASYSALLDSIDDSKSNRKVIMLLAQTQTVTSGASSPRQMSPDDFNYSMRRQIFIWFPITFALILFTAVWALMDMPIQKSSILYANYVSKKSSIV